MTGIEYEFRLIQDGQKVAGGWSANHDRMVAEARHYAMVYGQDGPVVVHERCGSGGKSTAWQTLDLSPTASEQAVAGEWITWSGGENPVPDKVVDVRFADGVVQPRIGSGFWDMGSESWWKHEAADQTCNIIAYRVVTAADTPSTGMSEAKWTPKTPKARERKDEPQP
jgi:hypothetical protein